MKCIIIRLTNEIFNISVGDIRSTVEMVRQFMWPAAVEGEDLSVKAGLKIMKGSIYPKEVVNEDVCEIQLEDEVEVAEVKEKKEFNSLLEEMVF
jgi:hypothetical protein